MAIPLRVIVLVIVIVVAAVSAIVVYFPNAKATSDAVDTLVAELRAETSGNLVAITRSQFSPVLTLAQTVLSYINQGSLNFTDGVHLRTWIPILCALGNTSANLVQVGAPNKDFVGCFAGLAYYRDPLTGNRYTAYATAPYYTVPPLSQMTLVNTNFNPLSRPWYVALKSGNGWSPFFVRAAIPPAAATAVGGPIYDLAGNFAGVVTVSMDALHLIVAMLGVRVGLTGRAMVYDFASGYYLAANFNQSSTIITNTTTGAQRLAWVNDTTDGLMVSALSALGGQNQLLQLPPTYATSFGLGDDTVYVDITPIQDEFGLNLRLLTAIRRSDFTADIVAQQRTAIGAAMGAVAGLAILCGIMIWLLIAPLGALAGEMNVRDTMAIDGDTEAVRSRSVLSEIAEIQDAHWSLQQELKRVKSYLPQSVLRNLERRGEGDETDDNDMATDSAGGKPLSIGSRRSYTASESHQRRSVAPSHHAPKDGAGTVIASMEAMLAVAKRPVSIVALNIQQFHDQVLSKGEAHVSTFASAFVQLIHEVVTAHRGVTHLMHGDRVFLSFNAASRVATHATRAVQTAVAVRQRAMAELGVSVTAGVASGEALVGMLGSAAQRQFSVLGRVFSRAVVLERLCEYRGFLLNRAGDAPVDGVLAESSSAQSACDSVPMRVVDIVALPQLARLQCVYTPVPTEKHLVDTQSPNAPPREGEWMYELDRARLQNPYTPYNDAMELFAQVNHDEGRQALEVMSCTTPVLASLREGALSRFVHLQVATAESVAMELGAFYALTCRLIAIS